MKYYLRIFGWVLLGMGTVLGVLGLLAVVGLMQVRIDLFGIDLDTSTERIAWVVAAPAGLALLLLTRPDTQHESGR